MDMVLDNPGGPPTQSSFKDPRKLASYGYGVQVIGDWRPPTAAVTFGELGEAAFGRAAGAGAWIERTAREIDARTEAAHAAGLRALYHTDMVLLPTALMERHHAELTDSRGRLSLERPLTRELVTRSLAEAFERFPKLDGLVIRTGEVYLQDLPYHSGADPILRGPESHLILLDILRSEACVRRGKLILYRTWAFDGFTTHPTYYLDVADHVEPHPLLAFSIKHTAGDFWRTVAFNPTLGLGRHKQVVEVECQREYEGKGAHPNYIASGVIDGFPELAGAPPPRGLADLAASPTFAGVFTWSRGGGWNGPAITDELWCDMNAYAISQWALARGPSERAVFDSYAARMGLRGVAAERLRRLAELSATAVLHGHYSTVIRLQNLAWTRDEYLGGCDQDLRADFAAILERGLLGPVLAEKAHAVELWREIVRLAGVISPPATGADPYLAVSSRYGLLLFSIVAHGWGVMLLGAEGERTGSYRRAAMARHLDAYDRAWAALSRLRAAQGSGATLYLPYSFRAAQGPRAVPTADPAHGMKPSIDRLRGVIAGGAR
ncbi:MAG: hypothetical protein KGJ43_06600 [Acidobacteriota bacterium]|nr:hypothetical protein [Acidobacteriota bacterium]